MPVARITKRVVDAAAPQAKAFVVYDTELKGFGLRVTPNGAKSYVAEYRPRLSGRTAPKKRVTVGSAAVLTADQAREAARKLLASVALGEDPAADRSKQRATPTFAEFAERYLSEEAGAKLKPGTVANYRIYLRKHAAPRIGGTKLDAVTKSALVRLHQEIGTEPAAPAVGAAAPKKAPKAKPITANRVLEVVASVFRYAQQVGLVPEGFNPAAGVSAFRESGRERYLTSEELERLGTAIRGAESEGVEKRFDVTKATAKHIPKDERGRRIFIDAHAAAAFRLLILTGARLREILHLRWEHVDFERGLLFLPDSKTGKKTIVLNAPALAVLSSVERVGDYVIASYVAREPGEPEKPRADLKRAWALVTRRAGLEGVRIHDLRHTNASIGAGLGLGLPIIGKLLGHKQATTTQRYAHLDADPLRKASNAIGAALHSALSGSSEGAKVVPLARSARR